MTLDDIPRELGINVAANVIAAIILGLAALLVLKLYRRRGVKKFFGFSPGRPSEMKIYLSSIAVKPGGTDGTTVIREGFYGDAITELEYRHALRFATEITSRHASWLLTTALGAREGSERIVSIISKSPSYRDCARTPENGVIYDEKVIKNTLAEHSCVILVGAPIYNILTHHILRKSEVGPQVQRVFEFIREGDSQDAPIRGVRVLGNREDEDHIRKETETELKDFFIVQKITTEQTKIFICAGTCTAATAAALDKLTKWRFYSKKFSGQDFACLYKIFLPGQPDNPYGREIGPDEAISIEVVRQHPPDDTGRARSRSLEVVDLHVW